MFSFRTSSLEKQDDLALRKGHLGVLCSVSAWEPSEEEYLIEGLSRRGRLAKVFFPDNGSNRVLCHLGLKDCRFIPLKADPEGKICLPLQEMEDLDALIVDFQDTGYRDDPMTLSLCDLFGRIHSEGLSLPVYILDRANICGRQVEGTRGMPQRHGLTLGELSNLCYSELGARFPLHIVSYMVRPANQYLTPWSIPPVEDLPGLFTSGFYCGMNILKGTDLSYGEGTCRPYELFGAPYLQDYLPEAGAEAMGDQGAFVRKASFLPDRGRYASQLCYGFQLMPAPGVPYHSVAHVLRMLRVLVADGVSVDLTGLPAVLRDEIMMGYVQGHVPAEELREYMKVEEQKWVRKARRYMLYDEQLTRVKTVRL